MNRHPAFRKQFESRNYQHFVIVSPGSSFAASAMLDTRTSTDDDRSVWSASLLRGPGAHSWSTWAHEIGHNLGLR